MCFLLLPFVIELKVEWDLLRCFLLLPFVFWWGAAVALLFGSMKICILGVIKELVLLPGLRFSGRYSRIPFWLLVLGGFANLYLV